MLTDVLLPHAHTHTHTYLSAARRDRSCPLAFPWECARSHLWTDDPPLWNSGRTPPLPVSFQAPPAETDTDKEAHFNIASVVVIIECEEWRTLSIVSFSFYYTNNLSHNNKVAVTSHTVFQNIESGAPTWPLRMIKNQTALNFWLAGGLTLTHFCLLTR